MPFPTMPALPTFDTERLLLRAVEASDLSALLAVNGDDDVTRYLPYTSWRNLDDANAWFERVRDRHAQGTAMQFVAVERRSQNVIGSCLLFNLDEANGHAEVGYVLGKRYWGAGYMREAVAVLIDYAFDELKLRRIEAVADPRNLASDRLLVGLGFTREGLLRERWVMNGEVQDGSWYGLLRREWRSAES